MKMERNVGKVYIVGAHSRGQTLAEYLRYLYRGLTIEAYLYDNEEENPEKIGTVKVIRVGDGVKLHTDYPVYVATRSIYHQHITYHLKQLGFEKIYHVTVELDLQLRNAYMEKYFGSIGRAFIKIDMLGGGGKSSSIQDRLRNRIQKGQEKGSGLATDVCIYVAASVYDKPLQQPFVLAPYEKEILTGVALSEKQLVDSEITDARGDNISDRNHQFCELTALYWIWKHAQENVIGLVHYRRHFLLPEHWEKRMQENGIDVILPIPLYVAPNIAENYKSRHAPEDWDYMMECLKARDIGEHQAAEAFFQKNLYSPCNMFIMRREVLDAMCRWLFPILFAVAKQGGKKENPYDNRYPGFLSERLITFFFENNRKKYNVVYADKNFLT